jgi:hypothetical protein
MGHHIALFWLMLLKLCNLTSLPLYKFRLSVSARVSHHSGVVHCFVLATDKVKAYVESYFGLCRDDPEMKRSEIIDEDCTSPKWYSLTAAFWAQSASVAYTHIHAKCVTMSVRYDVPALKIATLLHNTRVSRVSEMCFAASRCPPAGCSARWRVRWWAPFICKPWSCLSKWP